MTIIEADRYRKLKTWSAVQDDIAQRYKKGERNTTFGIPFGPQHEHKLHHPNPIRCLTNYHTTQGEAFVTHQGKGGANQINVWSLLSESRELKLHSIKNEAHVSLQKLLFIPRHRIFVAFCTDLSLRVFSDVIHNFQELFKISIGKTVLCMVYNKGTDEVVVGGKGFLKPWKVEIKELQTELAPSPKHAARLSEDEWVISLKIDHRNKQLLVLCDHGIHVLDYDTNKKKHFLKNRHDTALTCCTFFSKREYFITASKDGSIKVWNMVVFTQVHDFKGHYEPVTSVQVHPGEIMLISGSLDGTIRLWNLETFELFLRLDVQEPVNSLTLMNSDEIFYSTTNDINVLKLNLFCSLFSIVQSHVEKLSRVSWSDQPSRILASAVDGGVRFLSPINGTLVTIIYPMNTTEVWTNYVYDRDSNRMYVVVKCGEVMVFDCSCNPCIAVEILEPHSHDEEILSIALIRLSKSFDGHRVTESLVFAGLKDGKILLLNAETSNMEKSVQAHSGMITLLESSLGEGENDIGRCDRLVSAGTDNRIKIWSVNLTSQESGGVGIKLLKSITCEDLPKIVIMVGSTLFAVMTEKSVVRVYSVDADDQQLGATTQDKEDEHTDEITGMDVCPRLRIVATAGKDGMVKIWNFQNQLIQEMTLNSTLKAICFANERGDILVGLQNHVYSIPIINYLPDSIVERIVIEQFDDDIHERPVAFVDTNKINLDVNMVPVHPSNLQKRRRIMIEEYKEKIEQMPVVHEPLLPESDKPEVKDTVKFRATSHRPKTIQTAHIPKQKTQLKKPRIKKLQVEREDAVQMGGREGPITEVEIEVKVEGGQEGQGQSDELKLTTDAGIDDKQDEAEQKKQKFPVAPDGYIPNSVIRKLFMIKPPEIIPKQETVKFKLKTLPKINVAHLPPGHAGSMLEDSYEDLAGEISLFVWDEEEEEIFEPAVEKEEEAEEPVPVAVEEKQKKTRPERKVGFQMRPRLPVPKFEAPERVSRRRIPKGAGAIGEEEEEGEELHELLGRISAERWFSRRTDITPETALQTLMKMLKGAGTPVRRDVMKYIGEFYRAFGLEEEKRGEIVSKLQEFLRSDDVHLRVGAITLLGDLGFAHRDIILGLMPNLVHEDAELRDATTKTLGTLTGTFDKDGLLSYLNTMGVIKPTDWAREEDEALEVLAKNVVLKEGTVEAHPLGVTPSSMIPQSTMDSWLEGVDSQEREDLEDPLAQGSRTGGVRPEGESHYEAVNGDERGKLAGWKMTPGREDLIVGKGGSGRGGAPAGSAQKRIKLGGIDSKPTRGSFLKDRSTDSLRAARRGILGSLSSAESRKRAHHRSTQGSFRWSDSRTTDKRSFYDSTTATSMSGAGYSRTYDYSMRKEQKKESLGRLAESYRQKSEELLRKSGTKIRRSPGSAESLVGERPRSDEKKGLHLSTDRYSEIHTTSYDPSQALPDGSQKITQAGISEDSGPAPFPDSESLDSSTLDKYGRSLMDRGLPHVSADSSTLDKYGPCLMDRGLPHVSADSSTLDKYGPQSVMDRGLLHLSADSSTLDKIKYGRSLMDRGLPHVSADSSTLDKYGRGLIDRGLPHLSPVRDAADFETGEPEWRRLFNQPLTTEGFSRMQQRRLAREGLVERKGDVQTTSASITLPPISYIRPDEKMRPGEAGQRLLHSIHVKGGEVTPEGKRYRIDAMPGRLGMHTSTEDTGMSKYGILKMKWTTEMPYHDPSALKRVPLGFYVIPERTWIESSPDISQRPIAGPTSPKSRFVPLTYLECSRRPGKIKYEWDEPLPPPPRSRIDVPFINTEYDRYCQYHKISKQEDEETEQEPLTLPAISSPPKTSAPKPSPRTPTQELELPQIATGNLLTAAC